ncbi:MAG TPA: hypothetical protein VIL25_09075 [Vicinamibacterales bacterium]
MTEEQRQPSEEELRRRLEEELKKLRVEDVLVQSAASLTNLAGQKLQDKDLEQARLGIDGARALLPLLPGDAQKAVQNALAQLQMMYAREVGARPSAGGQQEGRPPQPGASQADAETAREEAERAKARAKLWTPPGV